MALVLKYRSTATAGKIDENYVPANEGSVDPAKSSAAVTAASVGAAILNTPPCASFPLTCWQTWLQLRPFLRGFLARSGKVISPLSCPPSTPFWASSASSWFSSRRLSVVSASFPFRASFVRVNRLHPPPPPPQHIFWKVSFLLGDQNMDLIRPSSSAKRITSHASKVNTWG